MRSKASHPIQHASTLSKPSSSPKKKQSSVLISCCVGYGDHLYCVTIDQPVDAVDQWAGLCWPRF